MNTLSKEESDRLLALLESHVRKADLSQREMERRLGLSQGYLGGLFRGRIQLKVCHVYGIARVLEMEPLYFFLQAAPPRSPEWLVEQLGARENLFLPFLASGMLPTRKEVMEIIRRTIQAEIQQLLRDSEELDPVQG